MGWVPQHWGRCPDSLPLPAQLRPQAKSPSPESLLPWFPYISDPSRPAWWDVARAEHTGHLPCAPTAVSSSWSAQLPSSRVDGWTWGGRGRSALFIAVPMTKHGASLSWTRAHIELPGKCVPSASPRISLLICNVKEVSLSADHSPTQF